MVKIKAQGRVAKNSEIFTVFLNATSGMGKLEILRTETPRRTLGEDQTVVSLKL